MEHVYGFDPTPCAMPAQATACRERAHRSGSAFFALLLIALGVGTLASRAFPAASWWTFWPLILTLAGVHKAVTPSPVWGWTGERVADGVGTVLVSLVLLGNTTGLISWGVWLVALTLWPVLLIAAGLGLLGRAVGQSWIRGAAPVLVWLALAYAVMSAWTGAPTVLAASRIVW